GARPRRRPGAGPGGADGRRTDGARAVPRRSARHRRDHHHRSRQRLHPGVPSRAGVTATILLTAATLVCFAANSLLCRLALAAGAIDAVSFTAVRLASGALALAAPALGARARTWRSGGRRL